MSQHLPKGNSTGRPTGTPFGRYLVPMVICASFLFLGLVSVVSLLTFNAFTKNETKRTVSENIYRETLKKPIAPLISPSENEHLNALRQQQNERLQTYGWIDPENNIIHMPIDDAIEFELNEL
jgi:hypothetical protein